MELVDSVLAAVLTFALLGTVVTLLVELIQRVSLTRSSGLKKMLTAYMDQALWPQLQKLMARARTQATPGTKQQLHTQLAAVTAGPLKQQVHEAKLGFMQSFLANRSNVTATQFLQAVSETEFGRHLATGTKAQVTQRLQDLASQFDEFGAAASEFFKRRAQIISIVVGVLLALTANIHGLRIYDSFLADPAMRERLISQIDDIESKIKPGAPAAGADPAPDVEAIRKDVDKIKSELSSLSGQGVPIGWAYYPNCLHTEASADSACKAVHARRAELCTDGRCATVWSSVWITAGNDRGPFIKWLFIVLITGVLIGLGGPFWFDIGRMLVSLRKGSAPPTPDATAAAKAKTEPDKLAELVDRMQSHATASPAQPANAGKDQAAGGKKTRSKKARRKKQQP